jgi:hypothetical protein
VFSGFKKFLPADTQKKMEVLDSKFHARLHQLIAPENLLPEYGGTSYGALGDSIGPWQDALPALMKICIRGLGQQETLSQPHNEKADQMPAAGHRISKEEMQNNALSASAGVHSSLHHGLVHPQTAQQQALSPPGKPAVGETNANTPIAIHAQNGHHPHAQPLAVELKELSMPLSPPEVVSSHLHHAQHQQAQSLQQGVLQPVHQLPPSPPQEQQPVSPGPHEQQSQEPPAVLVPMEMPLELQVQPSQLVSHQHEKPVIDGSSPPRKRPNTTSSSGGVSPEAPTIVLLPPAESQSPSQQVPFGHSPAQQQGVHQYPQQGPVVQIAPGGSLTVVSGSQNLEPFFSAALTDPAWQGALQTAASMQADYVPGLDTPQGQPSPLQQLHPKPQQLSPQTQQHGQHQYQHHQQQQASLFQGPGAPLVALGTVEESVIVTPQGVVPMTLPGPLAAAFEAQANDPQVRGDQEKTPTDELMVS